MHETLYSHDCALIVSSMLYFPVVMNRGTLLLSRANLLLELGLVPVALRAVNIDASQRHEIIELLD